MDLLTVSVELKGRSPLLMNRFPLEPIEAMKNLSREDQAEIAAYRVPDSQELYIPGVNIQAALIAGAVYSKGKGRASLQKPVAACVMVTPEYVLLGTTEYEIDSRAVVIQGKGRIIRHRPRRNEWAVAFDIEFDRTLVSEIELRKIVDDTCSRVGFLDFRPARKGPFGRAIVTHWKMKK